MTKLIIRETGKDYDGIRYEVYSNGQKGLSGLVPTPRSPLYPHYLCTPGEVWRRRKDCIDPNTITEYGPW